MLWVKCMLLHLQPPSKTLLPWRTLLFPKQDAKWGKHDHAASYKNRWGAEVYFTRDNPSLFQKSHILWELSHFLSRCPAESSCLLFWLKDEHLKIFILFTMWVALLVTYKLISDRLSIHWLKIFISGSFFINCSLETFYIMLYLLAWEEKFYPPTKFSIVSLFGSHTKKDTAF